MLFVVAIRRLWFLVFYPSAGGCYNCLDRPIHYQDVLATLYQVVGIDPHSFVKDRTDRPVPLLPSTAQPIAELA